MEKANYFQVGPRDLEFLRARWSDLAGQYTDSEQDTFDAFEWLVQHYSDARRVYHNLSHIQSLLVVSESFRDKMRNRGAIYFAIWLHDVIYDPESPDNETKSAESAAHWLAKLRVPADIVTATCEMILATRHHQAADCPWDLKAFLDLDLSILGAPEEVYRAYSEAIRGEYAWVPAVLYRRGRKKVLNGFLSRERIYHTGEMAERFERNARRNIEAELCVLGG